MAFSNSIPAKLNATLAASAVGTVALVAIVSWVWVWPSSPWSSAAARRRIAVSSIAPKIALGCKVSQLHRIVTASSELRYVRMHDHTDIIRVMPAAFELGETEWVLMILLNDEQVVGIGIRVRDNFHEVPPGTPGDRVSPGFLKGCLKSAVL